MLRACSCLLWLLLASWPLAGQTAADETNRRGAVPAVWFGPAPDSPDLLELFTRPEAWANTRAKVGAFLFSPDALDHPKPGQPNSLADLTRVDAFRKLAAWRIKTAIEAPAIKPWDCTGLKAAEVTNRLIHNAINAGGRVDILSVDEPLVSALARNKPICRMTMEEAGRNMAEYQIGLHALSGVMAQGNAPDLFEVEAYPSFSVGQLEQWLRVAAAQGYRPKGLTLDIDLNAVEGAPSGRTRLVADLREMQRFLRDARIEFGIIMWPGHDPLRSDRAYYNEVMAWARQVHDAIGRSDYLVFESWVTRCSVNGPCRPGQSDCRAADPPYCGKKSIPLNLPEGGRRSDSHARLIAEALTTIAE